MIQLKDGLYVVTTNHICAAFVVRKGEVTVCAPILRKKIGYYMGIAQYVPTDTSIPPPRPYAPVSASDGDEVA
jgi:hypothetical protein